MESAIMKAGVLIEALPYIRTFHDKVVVVKYGGSSLAEEKAKRMILEDLMFMRYVGMKPVLVHGGGLAITAGLKKAGAGTTFVQGFRVTDDKTLRVVSAVLSKINREFVQNLKKDGAKAFGIIGSEIGMIRAKKCRIKGDAVDLGFVGECVSVDTTVVTELLDADIIPVIAPLGRGRDGQEYNINADSAASAVAVALKAEKVVFLTNVRGILKDHTDPSSIVHTATAAEVRTMIKKGIIGTGMIPKVNACLEAIRGGVRKAHIIDVKLPHALLLEIFTDTGIGTEIVHKRT